MAPLAGTAVRVTPDRRRADEWATVLAAAGIPHRVRGRLDGWALVVAARDAERAAETLEAYDRENAPGAAEGHLEVPAPVPGAGGVGVGVALLLLAFFAITGPRAARGVWFDRGSAAAERVVAGEWWRALTALTLHADAPHALGNAIATVLLLWALGSRVGPGLALWLLLLAGAGGNLLTAAVHRTAHDSVGASTATFAALGALAALSAGPRGRATASRRWVVAGAALALLALLGTGPAADLLAHFFGLLLGGTLAPGVALARTRVPPWGQWVLVAGALGAVAAAWARALA